MNGWRKVASGLYIASANPANEVALDGRGGGSKVKTLCWAAVILDTSSSSDTLGIRTEDSPDGVTWRTHTAQSLAAVGTMLVVQADTSKIIGEHIRPVFVTSTTTNQFFVVDLYEIARPF